MLLAKIGINGTLLSDSLENDESENKNTVKTVSTAVIRYLRIRSNLLFFIQ